MKTLLFVLLLAPLIIRGSGPISTPTSSPQSPTPALTLEQRIQAQTAVEKIFHENRIWPKENKAAKPPFEQMVLKELIEKKVNESLLKSAAMEKYWGRAVTPAMLQAELERMAKGTQDAQTLHDLFEALGNDPRLIAETLARETLSDRLVRSWYAWDTRFHTDARARAEAVAHDLAPRATRAGRGRREAPGEGSPLPPGAESNHHVYILDEKASYDREAPPLPGANPDETRVGTAGFAALRKKYSVRDYATDTAPSPFAPVGAGLRPAQNSAERREYSGDSDIGIFRAGLRPAPTPDYEGRAVNETSSQPLETAEGFILQRTLSISDTRIEIESIIIRKTTFDEWWDSVPLALSASGLKPQSPTPNPAFSFRLPAIATVAGCDQWTSPPGLNNILPAPRQNHTAVWTGTEMIVWGGDDAGVSLLNTGGRYNPALDTWAPTSVGTGLPEPRQFHTAVWTGTEMIIWGGYNSSSVNNGARYDPLSNKWRPTSAGANVPTERDTHIAIWTGSAMIVWGGYSTSGGITNSGGRYDPVTDSWLTTSTGANVPTARLPGSAVWTGTEMIVWGGVGGGYVYLNSGGRYNPQSDSWQQTSMSGGAPPGRTGNTAVWTGSEMIVWGGYTCPGGIPSGCTWTNTNTGGRYNPASDSWQSTSTGTNTPAARDLHVAAWTGSEMIVWGGRQCTSGPLCNTLVNYNDGGKYNPATGAWTPTSTGAGVPAARLSATAVWSGSEMIVWGGWQCNGSPCPAIYFNSGGRYNPAADSWVPTSMGGNVPGGREQHSMIWTGSETIVWGGNKINTASMNSGGRYNFATDNWTPTSVGANVPTGRSRHTAVWTGNEMIIWGSDTVGNTGGRYNPLSDTWIPTSTGANVPQARSSHTAVWTGFDMIVWGGISNSTFLNSGGRFSPYTDSWLPTPMGINLPTGRAFHTAVWTGNNMIIWGGAYGTTQFIYPQDGGLFDPSTDNWQRTSVNFNTPSGRDLHTMIWTGTEMVVWGGRYCDMSCIVLNTGGRYNPVSDNWLQTAVGSGAPVERALSSSIWTGNEMIAWGGYSDAIPGTTYDVGGRYNPHADQWKSTAITNTPDRRYSQTAIWTGTQMVVWGGHTNTRYPTIYLPEDYLNTSSIYTSGSAESPANSLRGSKNSYINLYWSTIYGAGSYNVKRCNPTATGCMPGTIVSTPTINQYAELDDGLSHFYAVEAVNQCGPTP